MQVGDGKPSLFNLTICLSSCIIQVVFKEEEVLVGVHVKVFALGCIDPRFRDAFQQFIQKKFKVSPTQYDLKTDAGGSREIALKTTSGEWMLQNAEIAYSKHGARIFVLCNHIDCAHYGGANKFSGPEDEGQTHSADLKTAALVLKEKLPDIEVFAYLVHKEQRYREAFIFQQVTV